MDDLLVGRGHHALAVDLDDAVAHAHAAALRDAAAHQAADLWGETRRTSMAWALCQIFR